MSTVGLALWDEKGQRDLVKDLRSLIAIIKKEQKKMVAKSYNLDLLAGLELQVEGIYSSSNPGDSAKWPSLDYNQDDFLGHFFNKLKLLTVHAPCSGKNIASFDDAERRWSIDETNHAMDFTYKIGGSSLILHPGSVLSWGDFTKDRRNQTEDKFYESFKDLAKHYFEKGYDGRNPEGKSLSLGIENMDPPHLIMTRREHERVFNRCLDIMLDSSGGRSRDEIMDKSLKMRVDFSHYWNSHITLKENPDKGFVEGYSEIVCNDVIKYMENLVRENYRKIEGFHMAGCYNNTTRRSRITHGAIMPIPRIYSRDELNLERVLNIPGVLDKNIILEVFIGDFKSLIFSHQNVIDYIKSRRK